MILILLMNLCFAAALPLLKQAVSYGDPLLAVAIRMITGAILVSVMWRMSSEVVRSVRHWNWGLLMGTGCVAMYGVCVGEAIALEHMSATRASLIWALLPCITALIGWILYGRAVHIWQWLGIGMGTIGMIVLAVFSAPLDDALLRAISPSDMLMLGAVILAGWAYFLIERVIIEGHGVLLSNAVIMLWGGSLSLITWCYMQGSVYVPEIEWVPFLGYITLVALLVNGIGLSVQSVLITRYPIVLLALSSCITPLVSVCIGVGVFGEIWQRSYSIALICIMLGLVLFYYKELQRMYKGVYA